MREFNRWGVKVLESDSNITGPEAQKDMFEGEAWEVSSARRPLPRAVCPGGAAAAPCVV